MAIWKLGQYSEETAAASRSSQWFQLTAWRLVEIPAGLVQQNTGKSAFKVECSAGS